MAGYGKVRFSEGVVAELTDKGWKTGHAQTDELFNEAVPLADYVDAWSPAPGARALEELARIMKGEVLEVVTRPSKPGEIY